MNLDQIANIAEIIGVILVVLTLIFLTLQIRQNTQAIRASTMNSAMQSEMEFAGLLLTDAETWDKVLSAAPIEIGAETRKAILLFDEARWQDIVAHCKFEYMHANAEKSVPLGGVVWEGGAKTFIHKGTNGRWRDILTREDNEKYESMALENLGPECAHWLATGELPD